MSYIIQLSQDVAPNIPNITTSREEFITHIINFCEKYHTKGNFNSKRMMEGINSINSKKCGGHYFCGLIFTEKLSFLVILHELMHHLFYKIRVKTHSSKWEKLEILMDKLQYSIAMMQAKLECKILNLIQKDIHYYITE